MSSSEEYANIETLFGADPDHDRKYYLMMSDFGKLSKEDTIQKFQNLIDDEKKTMEKMGPQMEKCCVPGYSWVNEMKKFIKFKLDMIENIDTFIN